MGRFETYPLFDYRQKKQQKKTCVFLLFLFNIHKKELVSEK